MESKAFFRVEDLKLHFRTQRGIVQAVDGITFGLVKGRTLVIVGESGCGKSSLTRAILRLLPRNVHSYQGQVCIDNVDIMKYGNEEFRRKVRWLQLALVPQAAMNALNPVLRVEDQVSEPLLIHKRAASKKEALSGTRDIFKLVGVPIDFLKRYPFELSGGMRQRVAIAMALVTQSPIVVLDEPTSALDVLTQANIMNVLKKIKEEFQTTFILITHDIATSSEIADDAAVMYAGQIVEFCDAGRFYKNPSHPYSQKLMASVPSLREDKELAYIPGQPPSLLDPPVGCRFTDRCPRRFDSCKKEPPLTELEPGHFVKCWLYQ